MFAVVYMLHFLLILCLSSSSVFCFNYLCVRACLSLSCFLFSAFVSELPYCTGLMCFLWKFVLVDLRVNDRVWMVTFDFSLIYLYWIS